MIVQVKNYWNVRYFDRMETRRDDDSDSNEHSFHDSSCG